MTKITHIYRHKKNETCFSYLPKKVAIIEEAANTYLDKFPDFISNDDLYAEIFSLAKTQEDRGELVEGVLFYEMLTSLLDGHAPFSYHHGNGSLGYALGFSCTACDANLRYLREVMVGNEPFINDFLPVVAQ